MVNNMMSIGLMIGEAPEVDPKNKERAVKYWMYGADASDLAEAWGIDEEYAELKKCTNCEYFDNRKSTLKAVGADASMGACKKFLFVCSGAASCQAWECSFDQDDDEDGDD
jgi:hypothetical protein